MKDYCCCAIPLVNFGIYLTIFMQFLVALLAGILSVATPSIIGAVTPSFAPWIFGAVCFIGAFIQIFGAIGVKMEKASLFRSYVVLHGMGVIAAFAIAAAWLILSATQHSTAQQNCLQNFFPDETTSSSGEGQTLCNIFPWASVGIMGGLWIVFAIFFVYLWFVLSAYGRDQRVDHEQYERLHDANPLTADKRDPWDHRMSTDNVQYPTYQPNHGYGQGYGHVRHESEASATDVINQPHQYPHDSTQYNYRY